MHLTKKVRAVNRRLLDTKRLINSEHVFKAWKNEYLISRYMVTRATSILNSLIHSRRQLYLRDIKNYAANKHLNKPKHLKRTAKLISIIARYGSDRVLRRAIKRWKNQARQDTTLLATFKKLVMHYSINKIRGYFLQWKNQAEKDACWAHNELEDGPVNCELWDLKRREKNLEKFLHEIDRQPVYEVERLKSETQERYHVLVEKSLCRLLCKQEGKGLYLLPACLDQWKSYCATRKIWRRVLNTANNRLCKNDLKLEKQWAFNKLKYQHDDRVTNLNKIPFSKL